MGYSIGVYARSKALQTKMLDFMEKEYRPHWKIRGLTDYEDCYSSPPSSDPDYLRGSRVIGIDYGPVAGFERGYAFTIVRWMALQVGTKRSKFQDPKVTFEEPVPVMTYDGDAIWPVLCRPLSHVEKKIRWCCVDRFGMKLDSSQGDDYIFDLHPDIFTKAQKDACRKHGIDPDNWPKQEPKGVRWKIHDTRMRLLWPTIKVILKPMRAEMKRIDDAWQKLSV